MSISLSGVLLWLGVHEYGLRDDPLYGAGGMRTLAGVLLVVLAAFFFSIGIACCIITNDSIYQLQDDHVQ